MMDRLQSARTENGEQTQQPFSGFKWPQKKGSPVTWANTMNIGGGATFIVLWQNAWEKPIKGGVILAHSFRGFNPWAFGSVSEPVLRQSIMTEECGRAPLLISRWSGGRVSQIKGLASRYTRDKQAFEMNCFLNQAMPHKNVEKLQIHKWINLLIKTEPSWFYHLSVIGSTTEDPTYES